jgi:cytosol alanyl aminopeptidase
VLDALVAELVGSTDAEARRRLLVAIASTRAPAAIDRALALALDPALRQNERLVVLGAMLGAVATRDVAWAWLTTHFDALAPLLPDRHAGQLPGKLAVCDPQRAAELRAFFAPRVDQITGGPRNLALALEAAEQCAARASAQRASVEAYLR